MPYMYLFHSLQFRLYWAKRRLPRKNQASAALAWSIEIESLRIRIMLCRGWISERLSNSDSQASCGDVGELQCDPSGVPSLETIRTIPQAPLERGLRAWPLIDPPLGIKYGGRWCMVQPACSAHETHICLIPREMAMIECPFQNIRSPLAIRAPACFL